MQFALPCNTHVLPQPMPMTDDMNAETILENIMVYVWPRRSRVREFFLDFDRLRCGRCSKSQFARALNLIGIRLTEEEMSVLALHFADSNQQIIQRENKADFKVNYERFCEIVENLAEYRARKQEAEAYPRSDYIARPDTAEWSHTKLSPVKKLQSKVVEKRLRLYDHFQDFDNLRKGCCTIGQVRTVFTVLGLDKEVSEQDFRALEEYYSRDDGMFCYADFCYDIDIAFTQPGLERDPLTQLTMPDASSTLPARRNRQLLDGGKQQKVYDLEERIRARVKFRRCLLRSAFQDMDRTRRGHVTRSQFARVMCMLGFELNEGDLNDLCGVYCDIGNLTEFNYMDFCQSCDPKQEQGESGPVVQTDSLPKYFDVFGQVHRLGNSPRGLLPPISTAA